MTAPAIPPTVRTSGQFRSVDLGEQDAKRVRRFLEVLNTPLTDDQRTAITIAYLEYMKGTP